MTQGLADRFAKKFICTDGGCREWQASKLAAGYGRIREGGYGSRTITAHRASWIIHNGEIPDGMCVCHRCDNPPCVNPDHLFLGTVQENNDDRSRKGRGAPQGGESNNNARLSWHDVKKMRALRASGMFYHDIAKVMGRPKNTVWNACNKTWNHGELAC